MTVTSPTAARVDSEIGTLRQVMLHRPGDELKRLTPTNKDELLFDDVLWVQRARQEHDAFADALRERGVEVVYLHELLTEALQPPPAASEFIERTLRAATRRNPRRRKSCSGGLTAWTPPS